MGAGARPMLLWYVWIRLVDGTWHKLDDIARQLRIPHNAVSWAARFLTDHELAELGQEEIRLNRSPPRFEDVVKSLPQSGRAH